ncbi:MAG: phosphate acyltransferase [Oligoflexus sp.]
MSQMDQSFVSYLSSLLKEYPRSIALPESVDSRVLQAAISLLKEGSARKIAFFGNKSKILDTFQEHGLTAELDLELVGDRIDWMMDHEHLVEATSSQYEQYLTSRGRSLPSSQIKQWGEQTINQAAYLVGAGEIDAGLAGCIATTAEVIRAALIHIGLAAEQNTISGSFAMIREKQNARNLPEARYMFADCGVVIEPSATQLVDIAAATVASFRQLFPQETPRVAFLSFSTKGSAKHPRQELVAEATKMFQKKYPEVAADGDLQFDAAISPEVGLRKSPGSSVAGQANCFVFPNLDAGNIAYKLAQRLAFFDAYGPILQGTQRPFSDLSRGACAEDIKVAAMITMLRA